MNDFDDHTDYFEAKIDLETLVFSGELDSVYRYECMECDGWGLAWSKTGDGIDKPCPDCGSKALVFEEITRPKDLK